MNARPAGALSRYRMPMNTGPSAPAARSAAASVGCSRRHGPHHVAQKFTTTGRPRYVAGSTVAPCRVVPDSAGIGPDTVATIGPSGEVVTESPDSVVIAPTATSAAAAAAIQMNGRLTSSAIVPQRTRTAVPSLHGDGAVHRRVHVAVEVVRPRFQRRDVVRRRRRTGDDRALEQRAREIAHDRV